MNVHARNNSVCSEELDVEWGFRQEGCLPMLMLFNIAVVHSRRLQRFSKGLNIVTNLLSRLGSKDSNELYALCCVGDAVC